MRYPDSESTVLELKRELPNNDKIINTLIGFCNQQGGRLVIGVADSGEIIGVTDAQIEATMEWIDQSVYQATHPPIKPRVSAQRIGDQTLLVLEVGSGMSKPYFRKSAGKQNGTYIRLGRSTLKATPEIIEELEWTSRGVHFESLPCHQATLGHLNIKLFQQFLNERRNGSKTASSDALLDAYHLIAQDHAQTYPTHAGLLLFGTHPQHFITEGMIICSHFRGRSGREAIASIDCLGPLNQQLEQALEFIRTRLNRSFVIEGVKRTEELEIPEIALREALLNALIHRNYHLTAPTKVAIFEDRIEIFSPGQFPGPIDLKDWNAGITYLRNPKIAKVMREWGYVEKMGTGLINIFTSYQKRNLPPPRIVEGTNFIKCVLPRPTTQTLPPDDRQQKILALLDLSESITAGKVISTLHLSRSTATRTLQQMVEAGLIATQGRGRGVSYIRSH